MIIYRATLAVIGILLLTLILGCSALPDSAKSKRQIAAETWECLDSDERAGLILMGGREGYIELMVNMGTKEEIIDLRNETCNK